MSFENVIYSLIFLSILFNFILIFPSFQFCDIFLTLSPFLIHLSLHFFFCCSNSFSAYSFPFSVSREVLFLPLSSSFPLFLHFSVIISPFSLSLLFTPLFLKLSLTLPLPLSRLFPLSFLHHSFISPLTLTFSFLRLSISPTLPLHSDFFTLPRVHSTSLSPSLLHSSYHSPPHSFSLSLQHSLFLLISSLLLSSISPAFLLFLPPSFIPFSPVLQLPFPHPTPSSPLSLVLNFSLIMKLYIKSTSERILINC